jgi:outer membrane protein assembly factor BamB
MASMLNVRDGIGSLLTALAIASTGVWADDWPQFRGPNAAGQSAELDLPLEWSATKNVRWRTELPGPGNSSPIVARGQVFVTVATDEGRQRHLLAFDRAAGQLLWDRAAPFLGEEPTHETNPACASSPASDGERVFVWHASAGLHCYDYRGEPVWSQDLGRFEHIWGHAASPIVVGDLVVINCGPGVRSFVAAFDRRTGERRWQHDEPGGASGLEEPQAGEPPAWIGSWSTPVVATIDGSTQLLLSLPRRVAAFDVERGTVLWECGGLSDLVYTSVVLGDGAAIAASGYHGPAIGFRLGGARGDVTETHRMWEATEGIPQRIGSGAIVGEHLYQANEPGIAQRIEVRTGREVWKERLPGGPVWGAIVEGAGRLYVTNQQGETLVWRPNPERLEILSVNPLGEPSNSTPALADGEIFLRTAKALYCIQQP